MGLPEGYIATALSEVAVPVKKALGIGLSPCEERLCYENHVDVDGIAPADLCPRGRPAEVPQPLSGKALRHQEWWRPQLEVADPSLVYGDAEESEEKREFAPIGPSMFAPEVRPRIGM